MPTNLERWKSAQIDAAIERGVNPIDAVKGMDAFIAALPVGVVGEAATYIVPAYALEQTLASEAVITDARGAWYGTVEPRVARLLDASEDRQ